MIRGALAAVSAVATWLMAGALVVGFALPGVASFFRPTILFAIVVVLTIAMVRLDVERMRHYMRRPVAVGAIVGVNLVASPLLMWLVLRAVETPVGLEQGLILMAAAPMVASAVPLALILRLDAALAICVLVTSYAIVPLTLPAMSLWLLGLDLGVGFLDLFGRLFGVIAVPAAIAFVLRRWVVGRDRLVREAAAIDGLGVIFVVMFCLGIMDGLQSFALARPGYAALTLAAAIAANVGLQVLGTLLFLRLGRREALTVGLLTGNTNLGLVMVTLADKASPELIAYFVLGQVPMYFLPVVALPVYRRLMRIP